MCSVRTSKASAILLVMQQFGLGNLLIEVNKRCFQASVVLKIYNNDSNRKWWGAAVAVSL